MRTNTKKPRQFCEPSCLPSCHLAVALLARSFDKVLYYTPRDGVCLCVYGNKTQIRACSTVRIRPTAICEHLFLCDANTMRQVVVVVEAVMLHTVLLVFSSKGWCYVMCGVCACRLCGAKSSNWIIHARRAQACELWQSSRGLCGHDMCVVCARLCQRNHAAQPHQHNGTPSSSSTAPSATAPSPRAHMVLV